MSFEGFPSNVRQTPIPDPLFNHLLEEIQDLGELKVTLRAIWLLGRKRGAFRSLTEEELTRDPTLLRGVRPMGGDPREQVKRGLELAVSRRTLARYSPEPVPGLAPATGYLLNTAENRRELARRQTGGRPTPGDQGRQDSLEPFPADPPALERPNIFALYEDNIGSVGVMLAEELKEAEERYSPEWIADAFRAAIHENKRSWRYISAILKRWGAEGRHAPRAAAQPDNEERRNHGQPGRHPAPGGDRPKYPEDYQRR